MREIKFRAWDEKSEKMFNIDVLAISPVTWGSGGTGVSLAYQPHIKVMQYTGLKDKNGVEIYEGDIIRIRRPGRDEQTHYGDNIPLGSYTEPLEPVVTEEVVSVVFTDGVFGYVQTADKPHYTIEDTEVIPLSWIFYEISATNEDELKQLFSGNWGGRILEGWEDDKEYLFETYNVKSVAELIDYIGVEVISNIHEHPHLLKGE